jgi:hypothetical protein
MVAADPVTQAGLAEGVRQAFNLALMRSTLPAG